MISQAWAHRTRPSSGPLGRLRLRRVGDASTFSFGKGQTLSPVIGPAKAWQSLGWEADLRRQRPPSAWTSSRPTASDVLAKQHDRPRRPRPFRDRPAGGALSSACAPRWKTPCNARRLTSIQWHIAYEGVRRPRARPRAAFRLAADTLREGASLEVTVGVVNLSDNPGGRRGARILPHQRRPTKPSWWASGHATRACRPGNPHADAADRTGRAGRNELRVRVAQPGFQDRTASNNVIIRSVLRPGRPDAAPLRRPR